MERLDDRILLLEKGQECNICILWGSSTQSRLKAEGEAWTLRKTPQHLGFHLSIRQQQPVTRTTWPLWCTGSTHSYHKTQIQLNSCVVHLTAHTTGLKGEPLAYSQSPSFDKKLWDTWKAKAKKTLKTNLSNDKTRLRDDPHIGTIKLWLYIMQENRVSW